VRSILTLQFQPIRTFQEVVLPVQAVILCGSNWIVADHFFELTWRGRIAIDPYIRFTPEVKSRLQNTPDINDLAFEACEAIRWHRKMHHVNLRPRNTIPALVGNIRSRRVGEPVDRVWAIAGLLPEGLQDILSPMVDYSDIGRTNYWETYISFAKVLFQTIQSTTLLVLPRSINRDTKHLPSWCPDLSGQPTCERILVEAWNLPIRLQIDRLQPFLFAENDDIQTGSRRRAIHNHLRKHIFIAAENNLLRVRGFVVETVLEVVEDQRLIGPQGYVQGNALVNHPKFAVALEFYHRSLALARRVCGTSEEGTSHIPRSFLMSVFADCRVSAVAALVLGDVMTGLKTTWPKTWLSSLVGHRRELAVECETWLRLIVGHSFFATASGRFGIAQSGLRPGDKVCAFYGAGPLHILRWPNNEESAAGEHASEPAEFCGVAFIPYLMEQHERDEARLGPDEIFEIK
jgi:hypothetical protein